MIDGNRIEILTVKQAFKRGYIATLKQCRDTEAYNKKLRPDSMTFFIYINGDYKGVSEHSNVSKWYRDKNK